MFRNCCGSFQSSSGSGTDTCHCDKSIKSEIDMRIEWNRSNDAIPDITQVGLALDTHFEEDNIISTTVINLGEDSYFVQSKPEVYISITEDAVLRPGTVIHTNEQLITVSMLEAKLERFEKEDDVFSKTFLSNVILTVERPTEVHEEVAALLASWGCNKLLMLRNKDDKHKYQPLTAAAFGTHALTIAVPSRLRRTCNEGQLSGLRIAVKDLYDINGLHTGRGNRAYRACYPKSGHTSSMIKAAIDVGALVVGKTKTAEFGGSQEVVGNWSDYSYPLNARADEYFVACGSSTGSASALAAYPWLDSTTGTDGGGSIRDPAVAQGIFGVRPTHDGTCEKGASIPCPLFQCGGFFARSTHSMLEFGRFWFQDRSLSSRALNVTRLLYPIDWDEPEKNTQAVRDLVTHFADTFSQYLKIKIDRGALEDIWQAEKPRQATGTFKEFFHRTFIDVLSNDYWLETECFRSDYAEKFGRKPYVSPSTEWLWSHGSKITPDRKRAGLEEVKIHNDWFLDHVMQHNKKDFDNIMIIPRCNDNRRDEYLSKPTERDYYGFDSNLHASFSGVPNLVIPIDQVPFLSKISGEREFLPVSVSLVGPKGADLALIELMHEFLPKFGIPNSVLTGRTPFVVETDA